MSYCLSRSIRNFCNNLKAFGVDKEFLKEAFLLFSLRERTGRKIILKAAGILKIERENSLRMEEEKRRKRAEQSPA